MLVWEQKLDLMLFLSFSLNLILLKVHISYWKVLSIKMYVFRSNSISRFPEIYKFCLLLLFSHYQFRCILLETFIIVQLIINSMKVKFMPLPSWLSLSL